MLALLHRNRSLMRKPKPLTKWKPNISKVQEVPVGNFAPRVTEERCAMTDEAALVPEVPSLTGWPSALRPRGRFWRLACLMVAICVVWGVGLFCALSLRDAWQANTAAVHAQDVRFETERLLLLLRESETGERGFLLTGDGDFLQGIQSRR